MRMTADLSYPIDYFSRVIHLRYFWWSLVLSDLRVRYRRSFLGTAWSLARPAGMTAVLSVVFSPAFGLPIREYAPFLFLSIALWQFLVESMQSGCQAFRAGLTYIRQEPIPLVIFPLRTVLGTSIHAIVAITAAMALVALCNGLPHAWLVLAAVPGIVVLFLVGLALATVLGVLHTYFTDTQHLVDASLQALFYLTPVMYPITVFANRGVLRNLIECNPLTALLELVRQPLLAGEFPDSLHFAQAGGFLLVVAALAWLCLRRFEKTMVYWI
jgi:ABC-type polysaccharide/polyol phosphate export permease